MTKPQKITMAVSLVLCLVLLGGALVIAANKKKTSRAAISVTQHSVSQAELAKADGKQGHDCLVAIDGTVYLIKDFSLWQDGKHTSSQGLAYCGADLSKVIDQAPHGRKILDILPKVGPLNK